MAYNIDERLIAENGRKADAVILCSSADSSLEKARKCVDKSGVILLFLLSSHRLLLTETVQGFRLVTDSLIIINKRFRGI